MDLQTMLAWPKGRRPPQVQQSILECTPEQKPPDIDPVRQRRCLDQRNIGCGKPQGLPATGARLDLARKAVRPAQKALGFLYFAVAEKPSNHPAADYEAVQAYGGQHIQPEAVAAGPLLPEGARRPPCLCQNRSRILYKARPPSTLPPGPAGQSPPPPCGPAPA